MSHPTRRRLARSAGRRVRRPFGAAGLVLSVAAAGPGVAVGSGDPGLPVSGCEVPSLAVFDELMTDFMTTRDIGAGTHRRDAGRRRGVPARLRLA